MVVPVAVVAVDTSPAVEVAVEIEMVVGSEVVVAVKADSIVVVIGLVAKVATTVQLAVKVDSAEAVAGKRLAPNEEAAMNVRRVARVDSIVAVVTVQLVAKAVDLIEVVVIAQLVVKAAAVIPNEAQDGSQLAVRIARILEFIRPANRARPRRLNEPRPSGAQMQRHHRRSKSTSKSEPKRSRKAFTCRHRRP